MGVSKNNGTPKSSHFNRVFHYKPSILGVFPLFFVQHPYVEVSERSGACHVRTVNHQGEICGISPTSSCHISYLQVIFGTIPSDPLKKKKNTRFLLNNNTSPFLRLVAFLIIYREFYIPGGCLGFSHQQYFEVFESCWDADFKVVLPGCGLVDAIWSWSDAHDGES